MGRQGKVRGGLSYFYHCFSFDFGLISFRYLLFDPIELSLDLATGWL